MKKLLFAVLFLTFVSVQAGYTYDWYAGTSLGLNSSSIDSDNSTFDFSVSPEIGYIFNDSFDAGLGFIFSSSEEKTGGVSDDSTTFGIVPFVRYAAFRSGKFTLFARAQIGYFSTDYSAGDDETTIAVGFSPVVEYALSDRITLFTSFLALEFSKTDAGDDSTTYFGLNGDMNDLAIGFAVSF